MCVMGFLERELQFTPWKFSNVFSIRFHIVPQLFSRLPSLGLRLFHLRFLLLARFFFFLSPCQLLCGVNRPLEACYLWIFFFLLGYKLRAASSDSNECRSVCNEPLWIDASIRLHRGCRQIVECSDDVLSLPHILHAEPSGSRWKFLCVSPVTCPFAFRRPRRTASTLVARS